MPNIPIHPLVFVIVSPSDIFDFHQYPTITKILIKEYHFVVLSITNLFLSEKKFEIISHTVLFS